jgi:3-oxoacyl-[acyl-carrier-protein] synthase-1
MAGPRADDLCVVCPGARTPLGLDAASTAAAVEAGIAPFAEHPFMLDHTGLPLIVARDAELTNDLEGPARLAGLLLPAVGEAAGGLGKHPQEKLPVLLALPPSRPAQDPDLSKKVAAQLSQEFKGPVRFTDVVPFPFGHAGGILALEEACRRVGRNEARVAVVAGVDSYLDSDTLDWLSRTDQMKGERQPWGFIPGEAAGAFLVTTRQTAKSCGWTVKATLGGTGVAREENRIHTDSVCLGRGLSDAIRKAVEPLAASGEKVEYSWCDLNGQTYRADEFGYSIPRLTRHFEDITAFTAPADCWGDVGAATGPLLLLLALAAAQKGTAKGTRHVLWTSSDGGERSAAVLRLEPPSEGS